MTGAAPPPRRGPARLHGPATTPRTLRRWNAEIVFAELQASAALPAAELAALTGLSRPTVNATVDELIRHGWVEVVKPPATEHPRRGRRGRRVALRAEAGYILALDIGEFRARAALADMRGTILVEREHAFENTRRGGDHRVAGIQTLVAATLAAGDIEPDRLLVSSVGVTGGVDPDSGRITFSGALSSGLDLAEILDLPCPTFVANDANLAAIGEQWKGVGRGIDNMICVLASERLGSGIVVNGELVHGHNGVAGEMAFLGPFADTTGALGIGGYARNYGSEAIAALATSSADPQTKNSQAEGSLWSQCHGDPDQVSAAMVFAAAQAGDTTALQVIDRAVKMPARAVAIIALVLNPELIVLGGAIAHAGDTLLTPFSKALTGFTRIPPRLEVSPLAEHGVLIGGIRQALDEIERHVLDDK